MKYFLLEIQSDSGKHFLKTNSSNKETAIENFCLLYKAPKQAVKNVYEFALMWWDYSPKTMINKNLCTLI